MTAKPLDHIHIVGIVAEWLVAVLGTYAHAVRVPERNKPAYNSYRQCAGMPPSEQAAKPGPRRGAVQRPTLNNQATSMMLGLQLLPAQNTHTPYLTPDPCYLCALQRTQALRERAGPLT
jgi:hypothetical protein